MTNDDRTNETEMPPQGRRDDLTSAGAPAPRRRRLQPEARLALAVLEDAMDMLRATHGVESRRAHALAEDTWRWVASDDARHAFAFRWICQHLELDAEWLRAGLARWRPVRPAVTPSPLVVVPRRRGAA